MIHAIQTGPFSVNTYIVRLKGSDALIVDPACCKFSNDEDKFFSYLKENNLVPKVIFLTHGHEENIGALPDIMPDLIGVPVFASKYTLDIIRREFETYNISYKNLRLIISQNTNHFINIMELSVLV